MEGGRRVKVCHTDRGQLPKAKLSLAEVGHHPSQWILGVVLKARHRLSHRHHVHGTVLVHQTTLIIGSIRSGQLKHVGHPQSTSFCFLPWHAMHPIVLPQPTSPSLFRPVASELKYDRTVCHLMRSLSCPRHSHGHSLSASLNLSPLTQ